MNPLSNEQMRIAIAPLVLKKQFKQIQHDYDVWQTWDAAFAFYEKQWGIPTNYPEDLNACAEMRKAIPHWLLGAFTNELSTIVGNSSNIPPVLWTTVYAIVDSTPAQQCEAFLRVMCPELFREKE